MGELLEMPKLYKGYMEHEYGIELMCEGEEKFVATILATKAAIMVHEGLKFERIWMEEKNA